MSVRLLKTFDICLSFSHFSHHKSQGCDFPSNNLLVVKFFDCLFTWRNVRLYQREKLKEIASMSCNVTNSLMAITRYDLETL